MQYQQLLSIELTTQCNLGVLHEACPNRSPERYRHVNTMRKLDDRMIRGIVQRMYRAFGFRGLVAWHYYCEPLVDQERMFRLMAKIREETPEARFLLWTNGTLLPKDLEPFDQFERIVITDYGVGNRERIAELARTHAGTSVHSWPLDSRLDIAGPLSDSPCARMFAEFPIDAYGNVHLCCYDWRGLGTIGNVYAQPLDVLVQRWQDVRAAIAGPAMEPTAPSVCRRCAVRSAAVPVPLPPILFDAEIASAAKRYVAELRGQQTDKALPVRRGIARLEPQQIAARKVAVVFASYLKVPAKRLKDHFKWNGNIYRAADARVYVVTEKQRRLPRLARCVVYPIQRLPVVDGKPRFSICATKNAGIQRALEDGADVVIATDVDMAYSADCWDQMVSVDDSVACVPTYRMIPSYTRGEQGHIDRGATGTVSMTAANWKKIRWDERCVGYGADDGILLRDIRQAGITVDRDAVIYHVDHPGTPHETNKPGHGRDGCYGRDEFNFDNFDHNRDLIKQ